MNNALLLGTLAFVATVLGFGGLMDYGIRNKEGRPFWFLKSRLASGAAFSVLMLLGATCLVIVLTHPR